MKANLENNNINSDQFTKSTFFLGQQDQFFSDLSKNHCPFFNSNIISFQAGSNELNLRPETQDAPNIQRAMPEGDPIHDPLLDQYSRETGLPRERASQHDPGYEQWVVPIDIVLDMPVPPRIPTPDYSRTENELNSWEQANFRYTPQLIFNCESTTQGGSEYSYVTEAGMRLVHTRFEYFIARHIHENMNYGNSRGTWRDIHRNIRIHAAEHFNQYRQIVNSLQSDFYNRLAGLPNRFNPMQVSKERLETYVEALLRYFVAKLHYELWQLKCNWERTDYPNILRGIPNVISGRLTPNCGPQPPTPVLPAMITISPGSAGTSTTSQQNPKP